MPLQLDDLAALDAPMPAATGLPLQLPIASIDEDPDQPRREFETHALQELANTIRERGVRQPVSVRPNLQVAERWTLNFGARRLRAARLAGLTNIPAFIDPTADSYDQVIENEQREGLKPLELSLFVQKRLALGDRRSDIARRLGKSRQWVTLATALIEAPDWLLQAYREGRCTGMAELYELRRLHGELGDTVRQWAVGIDNITRQRVAEWKAQMGRVTQSVEATPVAAATDPEPAPADPAAVVAAQVPPAKRPSPSTEPANRRIHVEFEGEDCQLVLTVAPAEPGHLYVRPLAGGPRRLAPASALTLRGFVGR